MVPPSAVQLPVGAALWTLAGPRRPGLRVVSVVTFPDNVVPSPTVLSLIDAALWTLAVPRCPGFQLSEL